MVYLKQAILICLYLNKSGGTQINHMSANLKLSLKDVKKVLKKLKASGLITIDLKRPSECSLVGNPQLIKIIDCMASSSVIEDFKGIPPGMSSEKRALNLFIKNLSLSLAPFLNKTIQEINEDLVAMEMAQVNNIQTTGVIQ